MPRPGEDEDDDEQEGGGTATATFDPDEFMKTRQSASAPSSSFDPDSFMESRKAPSGPPKPAPGTFQMRKGGPTLNADKMGIQGQSREDVMDSLRSSGGPKLSDTAREGMLGFSSGLTGMPESKHPLSDTAAAAEREVKEHPFDRAISSVFPIPPGAKQVYDIAKGLGGATKEAGTGLLRSVGAIDKPDTEQGLSGPEQLAHGVGSAVGQTIPLLSGLKGTQAERVGTVRNFTTPAIAPGLSEEATANLKTPLARRGTERLARGIEPTAGNTNFRENLATALPDLKAIEEQNPLGKSGKAGGIVRPDFRIRQTLVNIDNFLDNLWQKERQPQIERNADATTLGRSGLGLSEQDLAAVQAKLGREIPQQLTLRDADGLLKDVNTRLRKVNSMDPKDAAMVKELSPTLDAFDQMHDRLHAAIGKTLVERGEEGIMPFNKRYAALSAVEDSMRRRMNPAESSRLLDNLSLRAGAGIGPGLLERLHVKSSPGRNVQKGLEALAQSDLATHPTALDTGVPPSFQRPHGPNLPGSFATENQQTLGAVQQPGAGDLWAGPPGLWKVGQQPGGPEFPTIPSIAPSKPPIAPMQRPATQGTTQVGVLPGMEGDVARQAEGAAKVKGEDLTRQANTPKDINQAAGEMESKSPLFRGTAASPQKEIFAPGGESPAAHAGEPPTAEELSPEHVDLPKLKEAFTSAEADRQYVADEFHQGRATYKQLQDAQKASEKAKDAVDEAEGTTEQLRQLHDRLAKESERDSPERIDAARGLVLDTIDQLRSLERGGPSWSEYNADTRPTAAGREKGDFYGGKAGKIPSGIATIPWLKNHPKWGWSKLQVAMRSGKSKLYNEVMRAADDHLQGQTAEGRAANDARAQHIAASTPPPPPAKFASFQKPTRLTPPEEEPPF